MILCFIDDSKSRAKIRRKLIKCNERFEILKKDYVKANPGADVNGFPDGRFPWYKEGNTTSGYITFARFTLSNELFSLPNLCSCPLSDWLHHQSERNTLCSSVHHRWF